MHWFKHYDLWESKHWTLWIPNILLDYGCCNEMKLSFTALIVWTNVYDNASGKMALFNSAHLKISMKNIHFDLETLNMEGMFGICTRCWFHSKNFCPNQAKDEIFIWINVMIVSHYVQQPKCDVGFWNLISFIGGLCAIWMFFELIYPIYVYDGFGDEAWNKTKLIYMKE